jgi:ABC-type multidrug transport system ATPase subunit
LDAKNAFDLVRVLRKSAVAERKSIIATLYQASNRIYHQFDKTIILAEGKQIYYGPASEAKSYFENMGFQCPPGVNISDFLTSVAMHTERIIRPGFEALVPNTVDELQDRYLHSHMYNRMMQDMTEKGSFVQESEGASTVRDLEKNRKFLSFPQEGLYTASFAHQVWVCSKRYT